MPCDQPWNHQLRQSQAAFRTQLYGSSSAPTRLLRRRGCARHPRAAARPGGGRGGAGGLPCARGRPGPARHAGTAALHASASSASTDECSALLSRLSRDLETAAAAAADTAALLLTALLPGDRCRLLLHHTRRAAADRPLLSTPDSKTLKTPGSPFDKTRLDEELKTAGEYGLRAKKEIWRTNLVLAKIRKAARILLTLEEKDPRRLFEGAALLRRMTRYGLLTEDQQELEFVLQLKTNDFLERRLQTQVLKLGMARSIHHARVMIKKRHIRVGKQIVNTPSFMVRVESQKHIDLALNSSLGGGRPGRVKRRAIARADAKGADKDEGEEGEDE